MKLFCVITDTKTGDIVSRSSNMTGVRQFAGKHRATEVRIRPVTDLDHVGGRLNIVFDRRYVFEVEYGSWDVLRQSVANWRNIYGAKLYVSDIHAGWVNRTNPNLQC